jgi:uncharacterized RDD family membrane protein YckC
MTFPFMILFYGWDYMSVADAHLVAGWGDFIITWVAPAVAVVMFWLRKQATPGKMVFALRVVDADTGNPLTVKQAVIRYAAYFVSFVPCGLGFLWVAFDPKKQGLHDRLAKTVVIQQMETEATERKRRRDARRERGEIIEEKDPA